MIEIESGIYIVNITIVFDDCENIDNAVHRKISKYSHLGFVVSLGAHGLWIRKTKLYKESATYIQGFENI